MEDIEEDEPSSQPLLSGWQQIHFPPQAQPQPQLIAQPQRQAHNTEWEMVADTTTTTNDGDNLSVFPPCNHEGLHILQEEPLAEVALDDVDVARDGEDLRPLREQLDYRPGSVAVIEKLKLGLRVFTSKIGTLLVRYGYGRGRVSLSFGQVAGVTFAWVVALWYLKWQRWRRASREEKIDGLILLVRHQDEKITRLVDQISHLNELLAYRRRGVSILHSAY